MDVHGRASSSSSSISFINNQQDMAHQRFKVKSLRREVKGMTDQNRDFDETSSVDWEEEERPKSKFPVANESELLLRKVRAVLNKLSPVNYNRLRKRYVNLIPHDPKQLTKVMQFLVRKAMDDPMYLQMYAHLMGYTVLRKATNISQLIRTILNAEIHHELQHLATDMEIAKFNRLVDREDTARRNKVMLHRFIAELFVEGVCTTKFLTERVTDLIGQGKRNFAEADEPLECLCVLLTFAGAKLEETKHEWINEVFHKMNLREAVRSPIISKRIQFMLLDLIEMRSKGWIPHNKWWTPSVSINVPHSSDNYSSQDVNEAGVRPDFKSAGISKKNYGKKRENTATIQAILNKVGPKNLEQMAMHCGSILARNIDELDDALDIILNHVLGDTMYIRVHAALLSRIVDTVPLFGKKLARAMLKLVEEKPGSVEIIRFFAELYNVDLIPLRDVITVLERLGVESACAFLLGAGSKLETDLKDNEPEGSDGCLWMNAILFSLQQKSELEGARLKCLILDTLDVRRNGWVPARYLHWNPTLVDPSAKLQNDTESIIRAYERNARDGIQLIKQAMTSKSECEQFAFKAVMWAIDTGDSGLQKQVGNCIKTMKMERLISYSRLSYTVGRILETVSEMKDSKPKAWSDLGFIVGEIYGN